MGGLPDSGGEPPYEYIVSLEVKDMEQLGRDMAGEEIQRLLFELDGFAEVTQLMTERFV